MLSFLALALFTVSSDSILRVSSLATNQEIEIEIESYGCFHHTNSQVKIVGGPKRHLTYYQSLNSGHTGSPKEKVASEIIFDGFLSKEMETQIDLNLDFYREVSGKKAGCTTQEKLLVQHKENGKVLNTEEHTDDGCLASSLNFYFIEPKSSKRKKYIDSLVVNPEKYRNMRGISETLQEKKK